VVDKYRLLGQGLFPETLPPCFDGSDLKRSLRGIVPTLRSRRFFKRTAPLIHINGTKHDGSRRRFSTPNPIQLFHVCEFISNHWNEIDEKISNSPLVVSKPRPAPVTADRPIIIPSLSNLTTEASEKLRYSPIIVKADISQFFPSIYTHSIPWVAHGRELAKKDTNCESKVIYFNQLDYFVQHCQSSETRGVGVGSDAFRIIAEYIGSEIDRRLVDMSGDHLIGGARHVDDFFLGVKTESDAQIVLSNLRSVLSDFHFQLNDAKTKIISGLEPLNETWAQNLRKEVRGLDEFFNPPDEIIRILNGATELATKINSDSPIKIFLRGVDDSSMYGRNLEWLSIEPYLQRICFHHAHCVDYVFLILVKRAAIGEQFDVSGWSFVASELIRRGMAFGHDHEIIWAFWLLLTLGIVIEEELVDSLLSYGNSMINSMILVAYINGLINRKPRLKYGASIDSEGPNWLEGLIARCAGYSKARFKGSFAGEFDHLADRGLQLIDFVSHKEKMRDRLTDAISHTRYGYDAKDEDDDDDGFIF